MIRTALLLCSMLFVLSCDDYRQTIVGPTGAPTTSQPDPVTLSGTIYQHGPSGQAPMAGVALNIWPSFPPFHGLTDSAGQYRHPRPQTWEATVRADVDGYRQPCRAASPVMNDTVLDVHLVSDAVLFSAGFPATLPITDPSVSGRVIDGRTGRPITGARVIAYFDDGMDGTFMADTMTDVTGAFVVCGLKPKVILDVFAAGYERVNASFTVSASLVRNFELEPPR